MTAATGEGFPKTARLRRRGEYLAHGRTAGRRHTPHFVLLTAACPSGSRLGITVSRKVGGAVVRNHVKRCVRDIFRRDPRRLLPEHDIVVIAKPGAGELSHHAIAAELATAIAPRGDRPRRG